MSDTDRLAVLIDADNISAKVAKDLFEELAGYGTLTVKRAYGDWTTTHLNGWKDQLHAFAISPMQQFAYTTGKNSTDSALIIDAMDLLYSGNLDGFVVVSSDSDFTRLATRLRESGKTVYGVGAQKTPRAFRDACDKFTFLEVLRADAADPGDSTPEATAAPEPERSPDLGALQSLLVKALNKTASDDEDWSSLGALGSHLNRTDPSFDARTYGFARLSDLVKEQPYLEDKTVASGTGHGQLWVRIKRRKGAAKKATSKASGAKASSAKAVEAAPAEAPVAEAPAEKAPTLRTTRRTTARKSS